jgi:Flp pilus assembly protein TadG
MNFHPQKRSSAQRGNSLLEFALVSVFLIPILVSTISIGFNTARAIQVTQVIRDAAHMYARFVDFSLSPNQQLLVRLASGLGMTQTGGTGVIILSKVTYIADSDCTGGGLTTAQCTNRNNYVVMNRIVIGNPSFHASNFGTPLSNSLDAKGDTIDYLRDTSVRAGNFGSILALNSGEFAFVAEGFFRGSSWTVPSTGIGNDINARWIF